MQTNPEQWAVDFAHELWPVAQVGPSEGIEDAALRIAATIQAAFAEREARLVGAIQDRDILIAELIAKAAVAVLFGGDEFWQRFHDEAIVARTTLAALKDRTHG